MKPQYESDRNNITTYDLEMKERKIIAESWDSSPHEVFSSNDRKTLYVTAEKQGHNKVFTIDLQIKSVKILTNEKYVLGLSVLPYGNLFFGVSSMKHPVVTHLLNVTSDELEPLAIRSDSAQKLEKIDFSDPKDIRSTLWNSQIFADAGYAAVAINPHKTCLDYVLNKYSYLDSERVASLGASYGGYITNWINSNSNKFKTPVNHDDVSSAAQVYYITASYFGNRFSTHNLDLLNIEAIRSTGYKIIYVYISIIGRLRSQGNSRLADAAETKSQTSLQDISQMPGFL
ncbi:hypothetical protein G6F43_000725 [Rhizopus delemar]|nr:hypothetical protein G6F43_000725 [Rhizopus delemar]